MGQEPSVQMMYVPFSAGRDMIGELTVMLWRGTDSTEVMENRVE